MKDNLTDTDTLCKEVLSKISNKGYILPSKTDLTTLLTNQHFHKIFRHTISSINTYDQNLKKKTQLDFYHNNYVQLEKLNDIKKQKQKLILLIQEKKQKLLNIKAERERVTNHNNDILSLIHNHNKLNSLCIIKNKIISLSTGVIDNLNQQLNQFQIIESFKHNHFYPKDNYQNSSVLNHHSNNNPSSSNNKGNTKDTFNIAKYIKKVSKNLPLVNELSNLIQQSQLHSKKTTSNVTSTSSNNNNNNSSKYQLNALPKLTDEQLVAFTQINQETFFNEIFTLLVNLKIHNPNIWEDYINPTYIDIDINKHLNIFQRSEMLERINTAYFNKIQHIEKNLPKHSTDIPCLDYTEDNKKLIKTYKVSNEDLKIITELARIRLMKDLPVKFPNDYNPNRVSQKNNVVNDSTSNIEEMNNSSEIVEQFQLPTSVLHTIPERLHQAKNLMKLYKKYTMRTDAFITKRIFPVGILLEEKYTDFINTINMEYDFFSKINYSEIKNIRNYNGTKVKNYSIKSFQYDNNILKLYHINSKYDLISYYFKYMAKYHKEQRAKESNKEAVDFVYKNEHFQQYSKLELKDIDLKDKIRFLNTYNYEEEYQLFPDESEVESTLPLIEEFQNVEFLSHIVNVSEVIDIFK